MELLTPNIGLVFWMSLAFLIVLFVLRKFAWSGILKALKEREEFIERSLKSAEDAKAQMSTLKAENENLLAQARAEREAILKEAKDMVDGAPSTIKEAASKDDAEEAKKQLEEAGATVELK